MEKLFMETTRNDSFNNQFCDRTKRLALLLCTFVASSPSQEPIKIINRQLLRSGTSVAANFRAASRARSSAEYYSKLCIVVEECDETLFWLEIISETGWINESQLEKIKNEVLELLKVFSTTKKKLKLNQK
jgi:four helix bundle protein